MIIMGIDPGSRKTGYAFLKIEGRKILHLASGVLHFDTSKDFNQRIPEIVNSIEKLFHEFQPSEVVLESLIFKKSPTALIKLAQTRGAILAVLTKYRPQSIFEYSPNLIKSTASGYGHSDKESVQFMLTKILGPVEFETDDQSDAVAVALCHYYRKGQPAVTTKSKKSKGLASSLSHKIKELR